MTFPMMSRSHRKGNRRGEIQEIFGRDFAGGRDCSNNHRGSHEQSNTQSRGDTKFNEYLQHDGLPQILELRKQSGPLDRPGKERYSRCVKSGLSDKLPIQLLFRGQPLRQHWVAASYEGFAGEGFAQTVQTDAQGKASLSLDHAGRWVVRTIQMIPAPEKDPQAEWESFWGTLAFSVDALQVR